MIGVAVQSTDRDIVAEFFELFKTPWEFYRSGGRYDVVISTLDQVSEEAAPLVLLYGARRSEFDTQHMVEVKDGPRKPVASYGGREIPIYKQAVTFPANRFVDLKESSTQQSLAFLLGRNGKTTLRIGYDLFEEVRHLLTTGQPPAYAGTPALELHIALLRDLLVRSGIAVVEIPPVPDGYSFMACLTHDLDHPVLRNHCCDHTMFGFLYRATLGSLVRVCRGKSPARDLYRNWAAAGRLPLVYLGLATDPWRGFDSYLDIEAGFGSTYFVIPKKGYAGRRQTGSAPAMRASRYAVAEIKPQLDRVLSAGCEVALHGLDAWLDSASGKGERESLKEALGTGEAGVRMHWLFFDERSPAILDEAGFSYDSSFGYNQTVGYRAGTAQAYKPAGSARLLELPLHVMDTALFFPHYLDLSDAAAEKVVWQFLDDVGQFGGALTINWHDRSIAPERLWDEFYGKLLGELKRRRAWTPTAAQVVAWFRKRRSASWGRVSCENGMVRFSASTQGDTGLPGLRVRVHRPKARDLTQKAGAPAEPFVDFSFNAPIDDGVAVSA